MHPYSDPSFEPTASESVSPTRQEAVALLHGLVSVPSLSGQEEAASRWLVARMAELGYDRSYVDEAGNAVGEMGPADARHLVVLLGHIDTVPGDIPVRVEETADGPALYGRGSVDAKGPLATFTAAVARLGADWVARHGLRLVVVGAVEEEAATSKGARFIRDRFDGQGEPRPVACIIGEPSGWHRVTLGYKGRILLDVEAAQPMAHTAGPDAGVATVAVDLWNWVAAYAARFNQSRERVFEQLSPSLRQIRTETDLQMNERVFAQIGIRLPLDFRVAEFWDELVQAAAQRLGVDELPSTGDEGAIELHGPTASLRLRRYAHEEAWRSDRNNPLVRSFLAAIRSVEADGRPGFVVKSGTSDMNVVGPAWRCPILAYGPGDSTLDHTPHEHLPLDEYWRAIQVLEQALRNLATLLPAPD